MLVVLHSIFWQVSTFSVQTLDWCIVRSSHQHLANSGPVGICEICAIAAKAGTGAGRGCTNERTGKGKGGSAVAVQLLSDSDTATHISCASNATIIYTDTCVRDAEYYSYQQRMRHRQLALTARGLDL